MGQKTLHLVRETITLSDIALVKFVVKMTWRTIINDFNPAKGNYLIFGLMVLAWIPYAVMKLKAWME